MSKQFEKIKNLIEKRDEREDDRGEEQGELPCQWDIARFRFEHTGYNEQYALAED